MVRAVAGRRRGGTRTAVTVTYQTLGIIVALITDPRTDHDTHGPERANPPIAPYTHFSLMKSTATGQAGAATPANRAGGAAKTSALQTL